MMEWLNTGTMRVLGRPVNGRIQDPTAVVNQDNTWCVFCHPLIGRIMGESTDVRTAMEEVEKHVRKYKIMGKDTKLQEAL